MRSWNNEYVTYMYNRGFRYGLITGAIITSACVVVGVVLAVVIGG